MTRLAQAGLLVALCSAQGCCVCDKDGGDPRSRGLVVESYVGGGVPVPDGDYEFLFEFDGDQASIATRVAGGQLSDPRITVPSGWHGGIELGPDGAILDAMLWGEAEVECGTRYYGPQLPIRVEFLRDGNLVSSETVNTAYTAEQQSSSGPQCGSNEVQTLTILLEEAAP